MITTGCSGQLGAAQPLGRVLRSHPRATILGNHPACGHVRRSGCPMDASKGLGLIPNVFYDIIAYYGPTAYLATGLLWLLGILDPVAAILASASIGEGLAIALVAFFGLSTGGQLLASLSFWVVRRLILDFVARRVMGLDLPRADGHISPMLRLAVAGPGLYVILWKRYARYMAARNASLASMMLAFVATSTQGIGLPALVFAAIAVATAGDAGVRLLWIHTNASVLTDAVDQQRRMMLTSKKPSLREDGVLAPDQDVSLGEPCPAIARKGPTPPANTPTSS